ncbi:T9SS type A sorting domain-containing protein [Mesonia sp.]|uniref:T9SS type A sorting domain-containing protein n=2 Tax=Mesonia sp. TaxID=1960830 RepID=UPI003F9CD2F7
MKKLLLSLAFLATGLFAQAQIANGSTAPDFTATDVDGNSHSLSTYLSEGKNVVMDVSATWCGPCWGFHQAETLKKLHYAYAAPGSDEIVVLFIEGDAQTTMADLMGQTGSTQGDWLTNTPYPVIDDASIANSYDIAYFPTLFGICSTNQTVYEVGTVNSSQTAYLTPSEVLARMDNFCGAANVTGVPNHGMLELISDEVYVCSTTANIPFSITNYGNNNITDATVVLKENGTVIATTSFSGNVSQFDHDSAFFEDVSIDLNATYTAELTGINGQTPHNTTAEMTTRAYDFIVSEEASNNITVKVRTDNYPTEISWEIRNSAGNVVESYGPYSGSPNGGGSNANTTKIHEVNLPSTDCYDVVFLDNWGDGWGSNPNAGIEIVSNGVTVYNEYAPNFTSEFVRGSAFNVTTLATENFDDIQISIYPNPSNGSIFVSQLDNYTMNVFDLTGKQVFTKNNLNANEEVNLSSLETGIYFVKVESNDKQKTIKLILK